MTIRHQASLKRKTDQDSDFAKLFTLAQLEALSKHESVIIELRYGFTGGEPRTLKDIGRHIGVSRERIRQILNRCHRKILVRGKRDIRSGRADKPCGALLSCINQAITPDEDDAVEKLVNLAEDELAYLPSRTHSLPLLAFLVFQDKEVSKQRVIEASKVLERRKQERSEGYKRQIFRKKLQTLLSFAIWFGEEKPLPREHFVSFARQRDVLSDSSDYAGSFHSTKLNRDVQYESELEYDFLQRLETFDRVVFYQEQPFKIPYEFENVPRLYYPDILLVLENSQGMVVEVKPVFQMALQINLKKWTALKNFCRKNGLGLLITDGRLAIQQVQSYDYNSRFAADVLSALERGPLSWVEYKLIRDKYDVTRNDFLALVLRHKLVWQLGPFQLSYSV